MAEHIAQSLRTGMDAVRLEWRDSQAARVDAELVSPLALRIARTNLQVERLLAEIEQNVQDL
ncbi:hypothetical protein [Brevibacterium album]|uniref:hypothetical protein n=1 Tax=Brevibacterium album TaxID=417948 RepID=UPI000413716E|nr:hypothetical protein [Brevibacterium album]